MASKAAVAGVSADSVVRAVLRDVLALSRARAAALKPESALFGAVPELDSMAVAGVLTELEDRLGIMIDDDEVTAGLFETFGALTRFVAEKTGA
jgi:acyl carrier protein